MDSQARGEYDSESVIPFAPAASSADGVDQVDEAGQTILGLLHKAAGVAEANSQHRSEAVRPRRCAEQQ